MSTSVVVMTRLVFLSAAGCAGRGPATRNAQPACAIGGCRPAVRITRTRAPNTSKSLGNTTLGFATAAG